MALPASGPISSSMIAAEFSSSQSPSGPDISLGGLGTKLSTPITYGNQVLMGSSFYGQSAFSGTAFSYNSEGQESGAAACALEATEDTAYHDNGSGGGGTIPASGDKVYSNSTGTIAVSNGTYKIQDNKYMTIINGDGTVNGIFSCGKSDRRLKRNIVFRTYSKSGIPVYEFEYIDKTDGEGTYMGTMAQDLIKLGREDAVLMSEDKSHYLVDYSKIDVDFYKI